MEGLYKNKYRVAAARLPGWDYSAWGFYFVTICVHKMICCLGEVVQDDRCEYSVVLSEIGKIVRDELLKTPQIRTNVKLDEWIIMPNHAHIIFEITPLSSVETPRWGVSETTAMPSIVTNQTPQRGVSTGKRNINYRPEWKPGVLGSIINQLKGAVTKQCRALGHDFQWQERYYDHIITDEKSLNRVRFYIKTNPARWSQDHNNLANIWY